ncbi:hypothetical protein QUF72_19145, partial [Desulfobacterales bacterium HSG2]|nr:hypothetical protein [Desulfobacterales bacterium HSG2]
EVQAAPERKKVSLKELVLKKFGLWQPEALFRPERDEEHLQSCFSAPPFAAETGEAERLREFLFRTFDLPAAPAAEEKPEVQAAPERKKVSLKELVLKKFGLWQPEALFRPERDEEHLQSCFSAPPFAMETGETERLRGILFRTFDLTAVPQAELDIQEEKPDEIKAVPEKAEKPDEPEVHEEPKAVPEKAEKPDEPEVHEAVPEKAEKEPSGVPVKKGLKSEEKPKELQDTAKKVVTSKEIRKKDTESEVYELPMNKKGVDFMETKMKAFIAAFALLVVVILGISFSNASKYYLKATEDGVEIWKGWFAPLEKELLIALPGIQAPEPIKPVYSKEEVYPLAFEYHIRQADALWDVQAIPDFEKIKEGLNKAIPFGTKANIRDAYTRLKKVDMIVLMSKADIAACKGTKAGFEESLTYLNNAELLNKADPSEVAEGVAVLIKGKIELIKNLMKSFESKKAESPASSDSAE